MACNSLLNLGQIDSVQIQVKDTGCGIPAADLPHIFERFYRGNRQQDSNHGGLGLAIAKRILDLHGSTIHVDSTPGNGAAFTFFLPKTQPLSRR